MSEQEKETSAIRPARVVATAMAAVTGAFFASKLGVYGTVVGVGLISLASTVGGELYLRSLDRTKEAAKAASGVALAKTAVVTFAQTTTTREQTVRLDLTSGAEVSTEQLTIDGIGEATAALERVDDTQDLDVVPISEETQSVDGGRLAEIAGLRRRIRWPLVAGGTVAAFVLAMIVITGIEALTGNSFSGGNGSTVGQIVPNSRAAQPVDESDDRGVGGNQVNPAPAPTEEATPSPGAESGDGSDQSAESPESPDPDEPPTDETTPPTDDETAPPTDEDGGPGDDDGSGDEDGSGDDGDDAAEEPSPRRPVD